MRWLWSARAIQCHLVFLVGGGIVAFAYFSGDKWVLPGDDWKLALAFFGLGYPLVLFLIWLDQRTAIRIAIKEAKEAVSAPDNLRQRKRNWRRFSLVFIIALGAGCIYLGFLGWHIDFLPAQYIGYLFFAVALAGICGVNIWYGGPIDPRFDPPIDPYRVPATTLPEEAQPENAADRKPPGQTRV